MEQFQERHTETKPDSPPKISQQILHTWLDDIFMSYGFEGANIAKTKLLIFRERQARAKIYRAIIDQLEDPGLFALFAYLSLADATLFYDFFGNRLQLKVLAIAPGQLTANDAVINTHAAFSWMYREYQEHESSVDNVKSAGFWIRFITDEYQRMITSYEDCEINHEDVNPTTRALRALKQQIMHPPVAFEGVPDNN